MPSKKKQKTKTKTKKTTPTEDVYQLIRLVNRRISSFMGGIDD